MSNFEPTASQAERIADARRKAVILRRIAVSESVARTLAELCFGAARDTPTPAEGARQ